MTKNTTRLERLQRVVELSPRVSATSRRLLLDSVLAKAERALAGEALEPADWTNAQRDVIAHRDKLLEWLAKQS